MLTSLLVLLVLAGLGVPAALYAFQDRLVFFPQPVAAAQDIQDHGAIITILVVVWV